VAGGGRGAGDARARPDPAAARAQPGDGPDRGPDRRNGPRAPARIRAAHRQGAEGHHRRTPPADSRHDPQEHRMKHASKPHRPAPKDHAMMSRSRSSRRAELGQEEAFQSDPYEPLAGEMRRLVADGKRRMLITSSGAGEGKSTVTANLGRALARSGQLNVVLVDTDQMRPT